MADLFQYVLICGGPFDGEVRQIQSGLSEISVKVQWAQRHRRLVPINYGQGDARAYWERGVWTCHKGHPEWK